MFGSVGFKVDTIVNESEQLVKIKEAMKFLAQKEVFIGIPQETNAAHEAEKGKIVTTADLLFIHSYGSGINRVPSRDVLETSLKYNKEQVAQLLSEAMEKATSGNISAVEMALKKAGMQAQNIARDWFTNPANNWAPNAPFTIEGGWMRNRKSGKAFYAKGKGSSRPLVDTGEMRKAITYVVDEKGSRR